MKLIFQDIYRRIKDPKEAELAIKKWLSWAVRSRLEPTKKFAKMVKNHFEAIMRYFSSRLTTGAMEAHIKRNNVRAKRMDCNGKFSRKRSFCTATKTCR